MVDPNANVKLEMHKGLKDCVYYVRSDYGNSGDSLISAKVTL